MATYLTGRIESTAVSFLKLSLKILVVDKFVQSCNIFWCRRGVAMI